MSPLDEHPQNATGPSAEGGPVGRQQRHGLVDALRGFALLGILVVNIEYIVQPASLGWHEYSSSTDLVVRWFVTAFAQTKIYPIFAMLFGYGFALQFARAGGADTSEEPFIRRSRRRNAALFVLGVAHGVLFFPGDILALYAIVGALCLRLRRWPTAKLLTLAGWVYGLAAAFWIVLGVLDTLQGGSSFSSPPSAADFQALASGTFVDAVSVHLGDWVETFLFLLVLQGPAVVASFAAGMALSRTRLLSEPTEHRRHFTHFLARWAPAGFAIAGVAAWASLSGIRTETIGFAVGFAIAPVVAASYVSLLAVTIGAGENVLARVLRLAGSMSLTVYLAESMVATTLAYGYGVGLFGRVSPIAGLGLAIGIWLGLASLASVWMSRFRFGPFEWLLRSVTYRSWQPLRR